MRICHFIIFIVLSYKNEIQYFCLSSAVSKCITLEKQTNKTLLFRNVRNGYENTENIQTHGIKLSLSQRKIYLKQRKSKRKKKGKLKRKRKRKLERRKRRKKRERESRKRRKIR